MTRSGIKQLSCPEGTAVILLKSENAIPKKLFPSKPSHFGTLPMAEKKESFRKSDPGLQNSQLPRHSLKATWLPL